MRLLAGIWLYRAGNVFGAPLDSLCGGFSLSFSALVHVYAKNLPTAHACHAIGRYLIRWSLMTVLFWVSTFKTTLAVNGTRSCS